MTEYSRIAKGFYTVASGALGSTAPPAKVINLPFQPDRVRFINYTEYATPAQFGVTDAYWDVNMGQGFAAMKAYGAAAASTSDVVTLNGISTFSAGLMFQYGARQQIIGATAANPIVFNVTSHGYQVGDTVIFEGLYQSSTTGMPQICGMPFTISAVTDANHFTVKWNGSTGNYTALSGSPVGAFVKKVLYPWMYEPAVSFVSAVTTGTTTTVVTTDYHNLVVGQEIAFRIPANWGITQLNSLPNNVIPGSPMYGFVVSITDNYTFVCNINSTGYTAYTANVPVSAVPGLTFPQVLAVGDVNTGGVQISSGSALYPPPAFPTATGGVNTINGPAIQGAFVNNTSQGFIIGTGAGATLTTTYLGGASGDVIYWEATLHDMSIPS